MRFARSLLHSIAAPLFIVLALLSLAPMPTLAQSAPLAAVTDLAGPAPDVTPATATPFALDRLGALAFEHKVTAHFREFRSMRDTTEPILQYFDYEHLPSHLQVVSKPFGDLARELVSSLPRNPERSVALRKLLEGKDAAVRAALTATG